MIDIADNFCGRKGSFLSVRCYVTYVTILYKWQNVSSKNFNIFSPIVNHILSVLGAV